MKQATNVFLVQTADEFYEEQEEVDLLVRNHSKIIFTRNFNNWLKQVALNDARRELGEEISVLDLACGRGGDLSKYKQSLRDRGNEKKVSHYVGADFSSSSLQSAKQRLDELKVGFPAIFIVADMTEETQEIDKVL